MADPSVNVPPAILPHIHLISSQKFPQIPTLSPPQALQYLKDAPSIVRNRAPMVWTYFQQPPQDGATLLTWQPPQRHSQFASDGYVWADPEQSYQTDVGGYLLEVLIRQAGCRYGVEPLATHRRSRFRIIGKVDPNVDSNSQYSHDPNLWIVHYGQTEPQFRFPAERIQRDMETSRMMSERQHVERQGQLLRKEFMLHDRPNWPRVEFSHAMQIAGAHAQPRGMYGQVPTPNAGPMPRHPQYFQQNQAAGMGPSPAKRPRQAAPPQIPGTTGPVIAQMPGVMDELEEENTTYGDVLDHLTPSEISKMRYTQHHEWMEEVYSSPYAAGQIEPIDLSFGLVGELSSLTNGIFETSNRPSSQHAAKADSIKGYRKMDPAHFDDFKKRVADYEKEGAEEIERMKAEHAKKIADLKKTKSYVVAERRLRDVAASSGDSTSDNTDSSIMGPSDRVQQIVDDVEKSLQITIVTRKDVTIIDKGGLLEEQEPRTGTTHNHSDSNGYQENGDLTGLLNESAMDTDNNAASLLDEFTQNSGVNTPSAQVPSQAASGPQIQSATTAQNNAAAAPQQTQISSSAAGALPTTSEQSLEGFNMDVDLPDLKDAGEGGENDWVLVDQDQDPKGQTSSTHQQDPPPAEQQPAGPSQEEKTTNIPDNDVAEVPGGSPSMFDTDFGTFDGLDTAGDALADFANNADDLGLDMDNSAFGDAFQGTEAHGEGQDS